MKLLILFLTLISSTTFAAEKVFRLHLSNEPGSLDPNKQRTSSSSYVLNSLYRNFYFYDDHKGLLLDLGNGCKRDNKNNLLCKVKKGTTWSDGSPLTAEDFVRTYKKILSPKNAIPRADLLFKIKNAKDIYAGSKDISLLGITAPDSETVKFEFEVDDPDFEYNLSSFLLAPTKEDLSAFNGPYKIKEWKKGQKLTLEPNFNYKSGHSKRPIVEFLFIEEDSVALQLYEKNELQFLRRLPTLFIPTYKSRSDYHEYPVIRLDYIGFGPELSSQDNIRKALTYSLNYAELQKIFSSKGRPGCIGLPDSWFPEKAPCFDFDLKKVPAIKSTKTLPFVFSALGGEDHKRATEWLQNQWSKTAHINTHLEVKENKTFLQILEKTPPALFRKGVSPDRPTCLAALETFSPDSPENFLRIKSPEYVKIINSLRKSKKPKEQKNLCLAGADFLMKNHLMIPLGPIHFSILAKPDYLGWKLNQMNQLDLSDLHPRP